MRKRLNLWSLGSIIIALVIVLPAYQIVRHLFIAETDVWRHIKEHLLLRYISTSAILVGGTVLLSSVIAVSLAWFVTAYDFPFRKYVKMALILPIAIPPYVGAYTYVGILSYTGPLQIFLRENLGLEVNQKLLAIRNLPGAIFIFSIFLYPYIYIAVRAFLEKNSAQLIESGRLLGDSYGRIFFRLVLPLLRVPLVAGATIVALDVLSDYAVVSYFGISSFSTAIFKAWLSFDDVESALRLSALLLVAVLIITTLEKRSRGRRSSSFASAKVRPLRARPLRGAKRFWVSFYAINVLLIALVIPVGQMLRWTIFSFHNIRKTGIFKMAWNTVWLAWVSAVIIVLLSLVVANYRRLFKGWLSKLVSRLSIIGYSIPSAVIAIAVLVFFLDVSPVLSSTIIMVIFAYIIRYFTIGYQNVESGFAKVGVSFHESSRLLGHGSFSSFVRVDLPMIRPAIIGAFILTFVDIAKELTITLILRPFNFYTLSTKVFEYAHDEMIPESSPASLLIVMISLIPVLLYYFHNQKEEAA